MTTAAPRLLALATEVPPTRHSQSEILDHFLALRQGSVRRERGVRAIFERAGVGFRHTVVDEGYFNRERTTEARNQVYMETAVPLGKAAILQALARAHLTPRDIDHLIIVSCTGFNVPGLDLLLAGQLDMRPDLRRTCVLGMGCYGAFPGLKCACDTVRAHPGSNALVLALELCSLHMQPDDSAETVVSSALFADGAAAAVISAPASTSVPAPAIVGAATRCDYTTLEHMAFTLTDHGFRMYLSSYVPDLLSAQVAAFVDELLARYDLCRADVRLWGIHPGSTKIVDYVQRELRLADTQVEMSHQVLHEYGNMSSATILFVLDRIMKCQHPQPGDYGVLLAFGPGLTMEGLLLRW